MARGGRRGPARRAGRSGAQKPPLGFWAHQVVEYLLALLLVLTALNLKGSSAALPCLLAAMVVASLAVLTDGPLGGFRLLSRRAHQALDRAVVLVFAGVPLLVFRADLGVLVLGVGLALVMATLVRRTSYTATRRSGRAAVRSVDAPSTVIPPTPPRPSGPSRDEGAAAGGIVRSAGFVAGRVGRDGPRVLGRIVGRYKR